jgi:cation diffusion facilitator CzcD-associated flavoprotein CzcO
VAIVGAGVSGICLGVQLQQAGIESFTIFEKADRPGGTWRDNTYPGLYCDVPSRYYSFSFAPHPGWSRVFAPGNEIQAYLEWVVDRFDLDPHIRYGTGVTRATWQDPVWEVELADGTVHTFDVVVSATGVLRDPNIPDIPGLDDFAGDWFHSARWNHGCRWRAGGSGSSAPAPRGCRSPRPWPVSPAGWTCTCAVRTGY